MQTNFRRTPGKKAVSQIAKICANNEKQAVKQQTKNNKLILIGKWLVWQQQSGFEFINKQNLSVD